MLAEPPEISCCFASLKVNVKYRNFCKIKNILVRSLENLLLLNLALCHPRRSCEIWGPTPPLLLGKRDILSPKGIQCHVTECDRQCPTKSQRHAMRVHQRQGTLKVKRGTCCCYGGFMARHRERQAGNGHVTQGTSAGENIKARKERR